MKWLKNPARFFVLATTLFASCYAAAEWSLDNDHSRLSFVTTKAGNTAEAHRFTALSGTVDSHGAAQIDIALASVNTMIDIRNDRMKSMLFETDLFPKAQIKANVDVAAIENMAVGSTKTETLNATLDLHGQSQALTLEVVVAKLSKTSLMITSLKPVIVSASDYALAEGVEKLRTVARLPSISNAVPVSFVLMYHKK